MFSWIKKKCTKKRSKRLRTSSISDLTRSHDYTSHPDTNIYNEINEDEVGLAYAVTSLEDILSDISNTTTEYCPLCRVKRIGRHAVCQCMQQRTPSPFKIRQDLTDDDDFSWLEYDFKASKSSLHRSRSEIRRKDLNKSIHDSSKRSAISDDSSGFYETDDSLDDILESPVPLPAYATPRLSRRGSNSPFLAPRMGCKVIKRTQSAVNTPKIKVLRKSSSDYLSPLKETLQSKNTAVVTKMNSVDDNICDLSKQSLPPKEKVPLYEDEDTIFDHLYTNVCIDINNLEIPKLRKSSYRSRTHGQNRLLNDLMRMNHDKLTFNVTRKNHV